MKKVLIALDFDPSAQRIAETGYELAKSMNARAILLHVVADATYYSSLNYSPIMGFDSFSNLDIVQTDAVTGLKEAAQNYLDKSKHYLGDETIETIIKDGDFGEGILEAAKEMKADIIVMGTHSRSGLDKILMGSVAEKVLHKSSIPLFIIPTKNATEK
ncbi:MAG TPA: universal stress protein [Hanamia sp.]|nr:universal stress protein [Hanamia sp.]